jgi:hypothetical protein
MESNDNGEILYTKEDVVKKPMTMEAYIAEIKVRPAKEIFVNKQGEIKTDKPEQLHIQLFIRNDKLNYETKENIVKYDKGNVPEGSQLSKFLDKYGKLEIGMVVALSKNAEGYYDLVI